MFLGLFTQSIGLRRRLQHQAQRARIAGHRAHQHGAHGGVGHAVVVQRSVGFYVLNGRALYRRHALQSGDLIVHGGAQFIGREVHAAPSEADQIRVCRVRAQGHAVAQGEADGVLHGQRIAAVKPAGHAGLIQQGHDLFVPTHGPASIALAEIAIQ